MLGHRVVRYLALTVSLLAGSACGDFLISGVWVCVEDCEKQDK